MPTLTKNCKIWIEKKDTEDNLVYAKKVNFKHLHKWKFSKDINSNEITLNAYCEYKEISCGDCSYDFDNKLTLTVSTIDANYSGKAAVINIGTEAERLAWTDAGLKLEDSIEYYKGSVKLDEAPTKAGEYEAKILIEGQEIIFDYTIKKLDPKVEAPTAIENLVYNAKEQALIIAGNTDGGELLYSLSKDTGYSSVIPIAIETGDYIVYYKVAGDSEYNDKEFDTPIEVTIGVQHVTEILLNKTEAEII